ncbi:unnamed protein product [Amoebophrya sp. A25]|nr:unnamed protein product [Amoebophrya sp. A25]|eukprot:GSA25T00023169001.1
MTMTMSIGYSKENPTLSRSITDENHQKITEAAGALPRKCAFPDCQNRIANALGIIPEVDLPKYCRSLHDGYRFCERHISTDERFTARCAGIAKSGKPCQLHIYSTLRTEAGELAVAPLLRGERYCCYHLPPGLPLRRCSRADVETTAATSAFLDNVTLVYYDLETGRLQSEAHIQDGKVDVSIERVTEIGATVRSSNRRGGDPNGAVDYFFEDLVHPGAPIVEPNVSGITNVMLDGVVSEDNNIKFKGTSTSTRRSRATFPAMIRRFFDFLDQFPGPLCLVAHNGHRFDVQVLYHEMARNKMTKELERFKRELFFLDSTEIVRDTRPDIECRKLGCLGLRLGISRADYAPGKARSPSQMSGSGGRSSQEFHSPLASEGQGQRKNTHLLGRQKSFSKTPDDIAGSTDLDIRQKSFSKTPEEVARLSEDTRLVRQNSLSFSRISILSEDTDTTARWTRPHRALSDALLLRDVVLACRGEGDMESANKWNRSLVSNIRRYDNGSTASALQPIQTTGGRMLQTPRNEIVPGSAENVLQTTAVAPLQGGRMFISASASAVQPGPPGKVFQPSTTTALTPIVASRGGVDEIDTSETRRKRQRETENSDFLNVKRVLKFD